LTTHKSAVTLSSATNPLHKLISCAQSMGRHLCVICVPRAKNIRAFSSIQGLAIWVAAFLQARAPNWLCNASLVSQETPTNQKRPLSSNNTHTQNYCYAHLNYFCCAVCRLNNIAVKSSLFLLAAAVADNKNTEHTVSRWP
jgi:hypothetical protein